VIRRESGVLKRIRATPLPTVTYLSAVLVSTLWVFVLQTLVTIGLGLSLYGAKGPENWLGMIPAVLVGVACFAGMGFGITALIRSAEGASAVVNLIVLPMAFLSGSFGPTRRYPEALRWFADLLPLTYLIRLLKDVYLHGDGSIWVGDKPSSLDRLVGDIVAQAGSPDKDLQRILVHENVEVPQDVYRAVMDRINAAGWRRIELDTQRGDPRPAARR